MRYWHLAKKGYAGLMAPAAPEGYQVTLPLRNVLISMLHTLEFRIQNNSVGGKISGKTNKSRLTFSTKTEKLCFE